MRSISQEATSFRGSICTIGVDIGASSCKAIVFDAQGRARGRAQKEYARSTPKPGWVELDTRAWWDSVAETIRGAISSSGIDPKLIKAIGLSSETDGMVPVDEDGEPLRPYIHWSDARCTPQYDWILSHTDIEEIYNITGIPLHRSWWSPPGLKMLWVKENEPSIFAKSKRFLQIGNYVLFKLTGQYKTDYSIAARTMLFDIQKLEWSERMSALLDIPLSTQPKLQKSTEVAGKVTQAAAEQTGLSTDTQVVTGGGDTECSALGAGVTSEGQALVSVGTSLMVAVARGKPTFAAEGPIRDLHGTGMFTSCHVVDRMWLMEAGSMGGAMLSWFRRELGQVEEQVANSLGISAYDVLNMQAEKSKPSLESLIFVLPNNAIFNLTMDHKRSDLIRGIQEGVAYEAEQVFEAVEDAGIEVRSITIVGGGAKSHVWRQIFADVTNRPVVAPDLSETGAYGAALLAGLGIGLYGALQDIPRSGHIFKNTPDPEMNKVYKELYQKYARMYEMTKSY